MREVVVLSEQPDAFDPPGTHPGLGVALPPSSADRHHFPGQPGIPTRAFRPVLPPASPPSRPATRTLGSPASRARDFQDAAVLAGQGPLAPDLDFGTVVEPESGTLTYQWTLENTGSASLNLVRSVNGKPCCGEVSRRNRGLSPPINAATL